MDRVCSEADDCDLGGNAADDEPREDEPWLLLSEDLVASFGDDVIEVV